MKKLLLLFLALLAVSAAFAQDTGYKKRVLENAEVELLGSYYWQDGDHAAVTGGKGTEKLNDVTPTIVISVPLNADDVLTIDGEVSAYTSASSSNIDPFDGSSPADAFVASSGASSSDIWTNVNASYSHSSDDRNQVWSAKLSVSTEFDYTSFGFGGSYAREFNEKNTELSVHGSVYLDTWHPVYPVELRPFREGGAGLNDPFFSWHTITGNTDYSPHFNEFSKTARNSYALGFGFSQILTRNMQGSLALDLVQQQGLLSTPFQRVYFADVDPSFIQDFQLCDANERLPDNRFKVAAGGRLNYYINEFLVVRTFYRYYTDDWGIRSNTASIEIPVKIGGKITLYPSYRYYDQSAADYFAPFRRHLSTDEFYTSDYDLSAFTANQFGFGIGYSDVFTGFNIWKFLLKSADLKYIYYVRNTNFTANMISLGVKFIVDYHWGDNLSNE